MSLRDLVTGSDACTPDQGAGPSNAFASLANTLLGNSSKQQERLSEFPGLQGVPSTSEARFRPSRAEDVARAAVEAQQIDVPGIHWGPSRGVPDSLNGPFSSSAGPSQQWHDEFQDMAVPSMRQHPNLGTGLQPPTTSAIAPFLHAFFHSAKSQRQFQPLPSSKIALSVEDQCRIRDRSTIMARQVFADSGDAFADEQVGSLLQSLHIDPRGLPGQAAGADWDRIFQHGGPRHDGPGIHDAIVQDQIRRAPGHDIDRWADQFAELNLLEGGPGQNAMVDEFLQHSTGAGQNGWAEEFSTGRPDWAQEFLQKQAGSVGARSAQGSGGAALEQTRALRDTMAESADPKFRNSKFLQFLSKMSRGEIILEDNQAKEVPAAAVGNQWAEEHLNEAREAQFEDAWEHYHQQGEGGRSTWADAFQGESHPPHGWAEQFGAERVAENWSADFAAAAAESGLADAEQEYRFLGNNPFMSDLDSFTKGKELFKNGLLTEAVMAFEAEVQRQPQNVEAWRLLGTVHAENDDDPQAIAALKKALKAAPDNTEALLSLGVSYTNELDQARALTFLMDWLHRQPGQSGMRQPLPKDARERLRAVVDIFREAAHRDAGFADVHVALGVLFNLSRDYDGAVGAFRTALQSRATDYSLWNKLGATLANSGRSGEAISAYEKALDLKPNYMRAWTNMGISLANIGEYEQSARFYIRALGLNPRSANVWGYLRTSLTCTGRSDLMQAVEEEDLSALQTALPL